jgi:DNA repair photolyase
LQGRFESVVREPADDGWTPDDPPVEPVKTQVTIEQARSIISRNDSPDVPFDQSINPYRGCEHGCIYCYARPSHAYLELSPGLDFETRLFAKTNAAELLREELSKPGYVPKAISLGANTDCYQPIERKYRITRQILEVLAGCEHPATIVTKSALIERDLDLLQEMAAKNLMKVFVSIGTLDRDLARKLEPRAASPQRRLDILRALHAKGIPCGVLVGALIPALNDKTLEEVLEAAAGAGAAEAAYVILRLPNELKDLFKDWLATHYPERAGHVISIVRQMRGGRDNDPNFGTRMSGTGMFADLIGRRFEIACRRLGLNRNADGVGGRRGGRLPSALDCSRFRPPSSAGQLRLF